MPKNKIYLTNHTAKGLSQTLKSDWLSPKNLHITKRSPSSIHIYQNTDHFFHVLGLNRISTGKISNLPSSIVSIKRILENTLYPI